MEAQREFLSSYVSLRSESAGKSAQLLSLLAETQYVVPVSIFRTSLSPLSCVVKYLHEVKHLPLSKVASYLGRSYRAVWGAYEKVRKAPSLIEAREDIYLLETDFKESLSILESVVSHLHEHDDLTYSEIARLIGRDPRTIWTVYQRAKKKGDLA